MNTDHKQQEPDLDGAIDTALLLKEETQAINGCTFEVLNQFRIYVHLGSSVVASSRNLSFVVVFNPQIQYIGIMKRSRKMLVLLAGSLALCAAASARTAAAADNPYQGIVERNVFGLKPPPPPPDPEANKPPPPKILLTGITTILGNKRALMKMTPPVTKPGEQPKEQAFTLAEGEREGGLEVLEIDEKAGAVKVNNYGTVATIDFENNGVKAPPAAAPGAMPPGMPPAMRPGLPVPGAMGGPTPMPNRPLRLPGAGASVTPQASAGAGLQGLNTGVNPSVASQAPAQQGSSSLEENLMMLEINRIKNQPLVEAGVMPPLPRHPLSEDMRAAIIGSDTTATPVATPTPARLPLPPGGPQPWTQ